MNALSSPVPSENSRQAPRALLAATAVLRSDRCRASQHLTTDLSTCGLRLCGVPHATPGDEVSVSLHLPQGHVEAEGRVVRTLSHGSDSHFAIAFERLSPDTEDAIHDAVSEALIQQDRRSVLLVSDNNAPDQQAWDWFDSVLDLCAVATTIFAALEPLEQLKLRFAILAKSVATSHALSDWSEAYPGIVWRTVDEHGRLFHLPGTTA